MENQPEVNQLPSEPVNQTKPNNFLVMLLSALLLVSCVIAGFFAFQTQKLVNELRVTRDELKQTPTPTASTEPTADPTADWKTSINIKYLYSLSHPSIWEFCTNQGTGSWLIEKGKCGPPYAEYFLQISVEEGVTVIPVYSGPGDENAYQTNGKQLVKLGLYQFTKQIFNQIKPYLWNGIEYPAGPKVFFYDLIDKANNRTIHFYKSPTSNIDEKTFEQILSTFKFTN